MGFQALSSVSLILQRCGWCVCPACPAYNILGHPRRSKCRHNLSFKDYDTAKLLKEAETQLKSLGQQLGQLEVAKRQAVEDEDYDRAKMLKVRGNCESLCPCHPPIYGCR